MSAFDRDEQKIHNALSRITVDASSLAGEVRNRLNTEIPRAAPGRLHRSSAAAVAVAMSAALVITAAAAALGSFDWFIDKINPSFGGIVDPVEAFCEDQGIRMEVIGAQKYDNMAIVYLSLQDISGQNRLTEQTDFRDGFSVKMNRQPQETNGQGDRLAAEAGVQWRQKLLYFDGETNTVYYEFIITADPHSPLSDPLELGSFLVYFSERAYENEPISVSLSGLDEPEVTPITQDHIWGGANVPADLTELTEALAPGHYAPMPHGKNDQWVSNIGILDGKLHIQIGGIWNREFGSGDATLSLMDSDGELIACDYKLTFLGDADRRLLDLKASDYADAVYRYSEAVFTVNAEELGKYTLCFTGSIYSGVEGRWRVAANSSDTSAQMRIWTNDISVDGHRFEYLTLSPLGLQVLGSYEGDEFMLGEMSLTLETAEGVIPLKGSGGSYNSRKQTFIFNWSTEAPLDVAAVTALIINGTRVPAE